MPRKTVIVPNKSFLYPFIRNYSELFQMSTEAFLNAGFFPIFIEFLVKRKLSQVHRNNIPPPSFFIQASALKRKIHQETRVEEYLTHPSHHFPFTTKEINSCLNMFDEKVKFTSSNIPCVDYIGEEHKWLKKYWPGIVDENNKNKKNTNVDPIYDTGYYVSVFGMKFIELITNDLFTFVLAKTTSGEKYTRHLVFDQVTVNADKSVRYIEDFNPADIKNRLRALCGDECRRVKILTPKEETLCSVGGTKTQRAVVRSILLEDLKNVRLINLDGEEVTTEDL